MVPGLVLAFGLAWIVGSAPGMVVIALLGLVAFATYLLAKWEERRRIGIDEEEYDAAPDGPRFLDIDVAHRLYSREFKELRSFFVRFHQDWEIDAPDDDGIIDLYLEDISADEMAQLRTEMDAFLALGLADEEMREALDLLYCYYTTDWFSNGVNEWVRHVRDRLR